MDIYEDKYSAYESFVDECIKEAENPESAESYRQYILEAVAVYFKDGEGEKPKKGTVKKEWRFARKAPMQFRVKDKWVSGKDVIKACVSVISTWGGAQGVSFIDTGHAASSLPAQLFLTGVGIGEALTIIFLEASKLEYDELCVYLYGLKKIGTGTYFDTETLIAELPEKSFDCDIRKHKLNCKSYYERCKVKDRNILEKALESLEKKNVIEPVNQCGQRKYTLKIL